MWYLIRFVFLFVLLGTLPLQAQDLVLSRRTRDVLENARKAWQERKLDNALVLYQKLAELEPGFSEAHLRLGQLYDWQRQADKTRFHYQQVVALLPSAPESIQAYQWLGRDSFQRTRYDSALVYYEKLLPLYPEKSNPALVTKRMIASAHFARRALQNPLPITKRSLGDTVNFLNSQFFPVLTADNETLIFTGLTPERDENMYISQRQGTGWTEPQELSKKINSRNNEGTCTVSADGRTLVFTACNRLDGYGGCDLYISRKEGDNWSAPRNLGTTVNTRHWESQPALSADGRTLYFASDRPGGLGKSDIWKSEQESGEWTQPRNLGRTINTMEDDNAPFIHANGRTLFYASGGLPGMGGLDIFLSQRTDTLWSEPVNIGYPINTVHDQVGLFITSDGKRAYYTDDRTERGKDHSYIYTFEVPDSLLRKFRPTRYAKGKVYDKQTSKPLAATIRLYNLSTQQPISEFSSQAATGQYLAVLNRDSDYALYVEKEGYLFKSLSFSLSDSLNSLQLDIPLEPILKDRIEILNNIFFATGAHELDDKSRVELNKLVEFLEKNPKLRIDVAGHTDDVGSDKANLDLSRLRAQAVVSYLTGAGIKPDRLTATGFGESKPKVPNTSEENRQQNRRIEWRIL
ncbi:OmpA family protein [Telluribacter sp.]|jgi:outer membrane protein OmpA-like peptidoglycan-associated protein|uniref:OmpA family protein n=1 Tax=Telluribacter sp. TaxID=1978767 RepID=UPI002E0FF2EB|nr:OmpA family protein [Telluribacter sp.]